MRVYMSKEYMNNLVGKTFTSSDSELKQYDGLKVVEVIRKTHKITILFGKEGLFYY